MAVSKAKKVEVLEILKENFKNAKSIGFTTNTGLTMEDVNTLRSNLRKAGGTFMLAKKTLIRLAMKEVHGVDISDAQLPGQVAVVCSNTDAIAGLGKVNESMREITSKKGMENKMKWVLSYFEGEIQDTEATKAIASMPSRETLLGRLVGSMQSPIAGLARFFDGASKKLSETGKQSLGSAAPAKKEEKAEVKVEETPKVAVETPVEEAPVATEESSTPATEATQVEEVIAPVEATAEAVVEETGAEEVK